MSGESHQRTREPSWLTLGCACRLLGVAPSTLRNWVDEGRIHCFRTPGGHRRFDPAQVQVLLDSLSRESLAPSRDQDTQRLSSDAEQAARALALQLPGYCRSLSADTREHYQHSGRQLLVLAVQYLVQRSDRSEILRQACAVGYEQGRVARSAGLSAAQTVQVFQVCSDMVRNAIAPLDPEHAPIQATEVRRYRTLSEMIRMTLHAVLSGYEGLDTQTESRGAH